MLILENIKVFIVSNFCFFMEFIRDAFKKVKQDMDSLKQEINSLKQELSQNNKKISEIIEFLTEKKTKFSIDSPLNTSTHNQENQTSVVFPSTHNSSLEPLKHQILGISTGNQGVPTDRQTDRQTDKTPQNSLKNNVNSIENAFEVLNSLDNIKKEIRIKFKKLTEQELLVFSVIYQLEEEEEYTDYKTLSKRLNLTESSVRDYVGRIIKKGIPVEKSKIKNKTIILSISPQLKKIASLATILQLRDI